MIWEISFSAPIKSRKKSHGNQRRHNIDSCGMLMFGIGGPQAFALSFMGRTMKRLIKSAIMYSTMVTYSTL